MKSLELGEKIKYLRLKNHLTLEQVGNYVGVGKSTVRKWENGIIENMRRDKIAKLAEILGTTPDYLMGWNTSSSKNIAPKMDESDMQLLDRFHRLNEIGKKKVLDDIDDLVHLPRYTEKLYKIKKAARGGEFEEEYVTEAEIDRRLREGVPLDDDTL